MWVVSNRKIFYAISIILMVASIVAIAVYGVKPGIDFTGGTLVDVSYPGGRPDQDAITSQLSIIDTAASVRPSTDAQGREGYIVRMKEISQEQKAEVMDALSLKGSVVVVENTFDSIGPILGSEALRNSAISVFLVLLAIVLFIAFAFRKVSEPVSSWKYGFVAIIALLHDVIIPLGAFAVLGHFFGYEVDTLFVTALLVILGFSVHDTIVVFDRVRENLSHNTKKPFEQVVGESVGQTFTRSINTSLTTLLALIVLYFFGGKATEHFSLALIIGIAAGTYSSVFVGSPLLVTIQQWSAKRSGKKK
jgi:preprotein translocase subunit SecF